LVGLVGWFGWLVGWFAWFAWFAWLVGLLDWLFTNQCSTMQSQGKIESMAYWTRRPLIK